MSLVSEALRKARAELHRRHAESGGLPPAIAPASKATPTRFFPYLLLASLVSGLAGAGLVIFLAWPSKQGQPDPSAQLRSLPSPPPEPQLSRASDTRQAGFFQPQPSPPPTPAPAPPLVEPEPVVAPPAVDPTPTPEPAPARPEEFVLDAKVAGVHLHLDYLVYGARRSFARINGQDVTVGSLVAGFTVEDILEDRVILRRDRQAVVLKLR